MQIFQAGIITFFIIAANIVISFIGFEKIKDGSGQQFIFSPYELIHQKRYLPAFLSNFSHNGKLQLLFNMLSFLFFGVRLESELQVLVGSYTLSKLVFLFVYAACMAGSVGMVTLMRYKDYSYQCLGASGAVAGIVIAAIVYYPQMQPIKLFFIISIPAPFLVILLILASFYFAQGRNSIISHESHLGGALIGLAMGAILNPNGFGPLLFELKRLTLEAIG